MDVATMYEVPPGEHSIDYFTVDKHDNLYVLRGNVIERVAPNGDRNRIFQYKGACVISQFAIDADGSIIFMDVLNGEIRRAEWLSPYWRESVIVNEVYDFALDADGSLLFPTQDNRRINIMKKDGEVRPVAGMDVSYVNRLRSLGDSIYVVDTEVDKIYEIRHGATTVYTFDHPRDVTQWLGDLCVITDGAIYCGSSFCIFARAGEQLGNLRLIRDMDCASAKGGTLYVGNYETIQRICITRWSPELNHRLQKRVKGAIKALFLVRSRRGNVLHSTPWDIMCELFWQVCN